MTETNQLQTRTMATVANFSPSFIEIRIRLVGTQKTGLGCLGRAEQAPLLCTQTIQASPARSGNQRCQRRYIGGTNPKLRISPPEAQASGTTEPSRFPLSSSQTTPVNLRFLSQFCKFTKKKRHSERN